MYNLLAPALKDGGQSAPRPGHYIPGMDTRYPSYRKLGGALGPVSCARKIVPPPTFEPGTVQSVASQYTDYTISAPAKIRRLTVSRWHACILPSFSISAYFPARFTLLPCRREQHFPPKRLRTYTRYTALHITR